MTRWRAVRALTAAAVAAVAHVALWAVPVAAQEGGSLTGADTEAVALNTTDGSTVFQLAFEVIRVTDGTVDQTNAAFAYSECEACATVAVSFQVVLAGGELDTVAPQNAAAAVNFDCTTCETLALAHQLVLGRPDPMRLTGEGQSRLMHLRNDLVELGRRFERGEATVEEVQAAVAGAWTELLAIYDEELVVRGAGDADHSPSSTVPGSSTTTEATSSTDSTTTTSTTAPTSTTSPSTTTSTPSSTTTGEAADA